MATDKGMKSQILIFFILCLGGNTQIVYGSTEIMKIYKKTFPDMKSKCVYCHIDEKPKKEKGKHDLNSYGLKVKELGKDVTSDQLLKLGSHEQFNSQTEAGSK